MIGILVFAGLFLPKTTVFVGFFNCLSRIVYTAAYIYKGSGWRWVGYAAELSLILLAIAGFIAAIIKAF